MPDEPVGVKLTFHVDPRQKRNLLSVGSLRKRTLIISYQRPLNLSVLGYNYLLFTSRFFIARTFSGSPNRVMNPLAS